MSVVERMLQAAAWAIDGKAPRSKLVRRQARMEIPLS